MSAERFSAILGDTRGARSTWVLDEWDIDVIDRFFADGTPAVRPRIQGRCNWLEHDRVASLWLDGAPVAYRADTHRLDDPVFYDAHSTDRDFPVLLSALCERAVRVPQRGLHELIPVLTAELVHRTEHHRRR